MKHVHIVLLFIFLITSGVAMAQPEFQTRPTACTIDKHRFELSLFAPSRYGIGEKTEVFTDVLGDVMIPNVGLKHRWFTKPAEDDGGFLRTRELHFATVHNIDYPGIFFKGVQKHKPSYIPDTCTVPSVITLRNEARLTIMLKKKTNCEPGNFLLTLRAGIKNSFKVGKEATMPPIDRHTLWYRESVVCLDTIVWFVDADLDIHITGKLNLLVDADFYSVDWNVKDWSGENKLFLYGYFGYKQNIMLQGGVKLMYGTVFDDFKFHALPMLDVSYFFSLKKKRDKGLFGNDVSMLTHKYRR